MFSNIVYSNVPYSTDSSASESINYYWVDQCKGDPLFNNQPSENSVWSDSPIGVSSWSNIDRTTIDSLRCKNAT